jgi:SAM-dependent methyltransferase
VKEPDPVYKGLVAQWYDRLLTTEEKDVAFYRERAGSVDGPILELGCGTGRILVPLRRMGKDVEGLDISGEMLAICREKLAAEGLSATLYEQDCAAFSTGRRYDMIFMSGGSFHLIAEMEQVRSCLAHVHAHLNPDGVFLVDVCRFNDESDGMWEDGRTATDGREEFRCRHFTKLDKKDQVRTLISRYELTIDGELARTQEDVMKLRWYEGDQLADLLCEAGFSRVEQQRKTIIKTHEGTVVYCAWP